MTTDPPPVPTPASTVIIGRDGPMGIEMFMVLRHEKSNFASGALVFPGGKIDENDKLPALRSFCTGAEGVEDSMLCIMVAAIRETFEESGILLARHGDDDNILSGGRLASLDGYRQPLNSGELTLVEFLKKEDIKLACDQLTFFAHWITPEMVPRRFDTRFFLANAPEGHDGAHDGTESVDSIWISTQDAISEYKDGKYFIMFPTRMNIQKLGRNRTMDDALAAARSTRVTTVSPWVEERESGAALCIPEEAGYGITAESLETVMGLKRPAS
jgi:8-oxo-dGTP pyrophosphatase MutT (NUDIX family)